ncbi:RND family transporter [Bacteroides helcogenes]|uniref:Exporter of the RND superfamily protein-like protein n=1 Tax=Bacteroides helcogenes (strain ATCC 35417 / DSM 20613 / JCM 6297 / CCUG 15421 / P 36-108) TaxID=693979 RepID=E6SP63_BACT6|nr:MMPL family transporter [Bacteroides helcogenes]ADV43833.1 exporter of the RND superfamily protein-like protein [Bacteroides helcogenes P 36-108]MDY5237464.1 MMPL family transporter [Bacteroides helcogenes]
MKIEKINARFRTFSGHLLQNRWPVLLVIATAIGLSVFGIRKLVVQTSFDDYFIEGDPMLVKTNEFKSHFGNDYFVGVLTRCDNLFSKKNLETLRNLSNELLDSLSYADKITSLTDIEFLAGNNEGMTIEQIVPEDIPGDAAGMDSIRTRAYSKPEVARKLVSKDGTLSWIVVKLRPFPADSVWKKTTTVSPDIQTGTEVERIISKPQYASLHPEATGMPFVSQQKVKYISTEMSRLVKFAILISIVVMWLMTRSVKGVIAPFIATFGGLLFTYGIAGQFNLYVDSATSIIPVIMAFAVSIAYNIHLFAFFNKRMLIHGRRQQAIIETVSETGWPILFCGLTTIVSLLSFLAVAIRPVAFIGINTSLCVFFVLLTTLVVTPIILSFGKDKKPRDGFTENSDTRWSHIMVRLGEFDRHHPKGICTVFILLCIPLVIGISKVEPAFDMERTMGSKVPYVNRLLNVSRSELGSLYSYDIMIDFPEDGQAKLPANLKKLEEMTHIAKEYEQTKRTTSILDILKDLNQTLNGNDARFYRIPDKEEEVAQLLLLYENAGGTESEYWMDYDYKRLRLMVEMGYYNSAEAERELADIEQRAAQLFPGAKVTAVGNVPQFTTMMQYLVRGQMQSFLISVLIIGIILMIVFQSVRVGLIGLIPNIFPALVVGGYMGWTGIPLDMMTATIIPMMLGMAVDDTIHFIAHANLEYDRTSHYHTAIRRTFRVVGVAIVTTSIITIAVFAEFMSSGSLQLFNFGLLAIIGIFSALLADLFITPILVTKCKVFGKKLINKTNRNK